MVRPLIIVVGMDSLLCFYACLFLKNRSLLNGYEHRLAHLPNPRKPGNGSPCRHRRRCAGVGGLARCPGRIADAAGSTGAVQRTIAGRVSWRFARAGRFGYGCRRLGTNGLSASEPTTE